MTTTPNPLGGYNLTRVSVLSGKEHTLRLPTLTEAKLPWLDREHRNLYNVNIQDVLPELSPEEREFVLNGVTSDEWKLLIA